MRARPQLILASALALLLATTAEAGSPKWEQAREVRNAGRITAVTGIGLAVVAFPAGFVAGGFKSIGCDEPGECPGLAIAGVAIGVGGLTFLSGLTTAIVGAVMWNNADRTMWEEEHPETRRRKPPVSLSAGASWQSHGGGLVLHGTF